MTGGTLRLVLAWAVMLALLAATIGATFLPLGAARPAVSYGIAAAKGGLIFWFFMEMRREGGLARLAALAGFIWLAILLSLVAADYATRGWTASSAVAPDGR